MEECFVGFCFGTTVNGQCMEFGKEAQLFIIVYTVSYFFVIEE